MEMAPGAQAQRSAAGPQRGPGRVAALASLLQRLRARAGLLLPPLPHPQVLAGAGKSLARPLQQALLLPPMLTLPCVPF